MGFTFDGATVRGEVSLSDGSTVKTAPQITNTIYYTGGATSNNIVPTGKKWIITSATALGTGSTCMIQIYNGATEIFQLVRVSSSGVYDRMNQSIIVPAGYDVRITREGYFSYYEEDA